MAEPDFDIVAAGFEPSCKRLSAPPPLRRALCGLDQYLVDPPAVHFDDPKTPSIPGELFSGLGDMAELRQHEARERHEVADRRLPEASQVCHFPYWHRSVDQKRAIRITRYFRLGADFNVGKIAGNGFEQIGASHDPLDRAVLIDDDRGVNRRLSEQIERS
jgi:hypothetical protein